MIRWAFILTLILSCFSVQAEKMQLKTHTHLIKKLELVLTKLNSNRSTHFKVSARLADLYSERARLIEMKEIEENCKKCTGALKDRKRALQLYKSIFTQPKNKEFVLLQIAHLYELTHNKSKAIKFYTEVIKNRKKVYSKKLISASHAGLAELYFQNSQFQKSLNHYRKSLKNIAEARKGFVRYRISWCYLHTGRLKKAIINIKSLLRSPKHLVNAKTGKYDSGFHEVVSKDLATFLVHSDSLPIAQAQILSQLSPQRIRRDNLYYLAKETHRLGHKKSALLIWNFLIQTEKDKLYQLEAQIHVADLYYNLGQKNKTILTLQKSAQIWKRHGCGDEDRCLSLRNKMRTLIIRWNKIEIKKPSHQLFSAYKIFSELNKKDLDIHYWAANLAQRLSLWKESIQFYRQSHSLAVSQKNRKIQLGSLLGEIESAELSNNRRFKKAAYTNYLKYESKNPQALPIRYQLAYLDHEQKKFKKSAVAFYNLARSKQPGYRSFKKKSADLSLEALEHLKDNLRTDQYAREFAQSQPSYKDEFIALSRQASLNIVANTINQKSQKSSQLRKAEKRLATISLRGASKKEKIAYYTNKIAIGERTKNLNLVQQGASGLLSIKNLSVQNKNLSFKKLLQIYEMKFQFKKAYRMAQLIHWKDLTLAQKELKLAILADLANLNSKKHYKAFIKLTNSIKKANTIRVRLIRRSPKPWTLIIKDLHKLRRTPTLLSSLILDIYSKYPNEKRLRQVMKIRHVALSAEIMILQRSKELIQINKQINTLSAHRINRRSQATIQKTLGDRLKLLTALKKKAKKTTLKKDWFQQLISFTAFKKENHRLYKELLKLPTPRGLNKKEATQYKTILKSQAQVYLKESQATNKQINKLLANKKPLEEMGSIYSQANNAAKKMIRHQLNLIKKIDSYSIQRKIRKILTSQDKNQRKARLKSKQLILSIIKNPFDTQAIKKLRDLEDLQGHTIMTAYLDRRLQKIKRGLE